MRSSFPFEVMLLSLLSWVITKLHTVNSVCNFSSAYHKAIFRLKFIWRWRFVDGREGLKLYISANGQVISESLALIKYPNSLLQTHYGHFTQWCSSINCQQWSNVNYWDSKVFANCYQVQKRLQVLLQNSSDVWRGLITAILFSGAQLSVTKVLSASSLIIAGDSIWTWYFSVCCFLPIEFTSASHTVHTNCILCWAITVLFKTNIITVCLSILQLPLP